MMSTPKQPVKLSLLVRQGRNSGWPELRPELPQLRYLAYKAGTMALNLLPKKLITTKSLIIP